MPWAARADSENRGGALGCNTSRRVVGTASQTDDENPSSALGHSEVASVEDPVRHAIPEFDHRTEECRHVSPAMTGEESRYVFEEDGGRSMAFHKDEEGIGEVGAGAFDHASPLSCDGEVLTGEAAGPEGSRTPGLVPPQLLLIVGCSRSADTILMLALLSAPPPVSDSGDVTEVRDSGPSLGEDGAGIRVDLREGDGSPAGTFQPKVKSADSGEEAGVRSLIQHWPHATESSSTVTRIGRIQYAIQARRARMRSAVRRITAGPPR
jgi:hypothetical protein